METAIVKCIEKQKLMTLATSEEGMPYCASLFYAFLPANDLLVFKSDPQTIHIQQALKNGSVAGTIHANPVTILKLQGIQFTGFFTPLSETDLFDAASQVYMKKFPFAGVIHQADFWAIKLHHIKMTDNRLGFGKKLIWDARKVTEIG